MEDFGHAGMQSHIQQICINMTVMECGWGRSASGGCEKYHAVRECRHIHLKSWQLHENSGCFLVLGFGTRKMFSFWHYRHVFGWFRLAAETLNTQQPWAWENMDWTKQSGASRIAGCRSFQNHGMKLIWIVNVNVDSFLKFGQFVSYSDGIANRCSVAIL
jgi:hypothetical protein